MRVVFLVYLLEYNYKLLEGIVLFIGIIGIVRYFINKFIFIFKENRF